MSKFGAAVQSDSVAAAVLCSSSAFLHLTITLYDRDETGEEVAAATVLWPFAIVQLSTF